MHSKYGYILILILVFHSLTSYAGKRDTTAYVTVEYLKNNIDKDTAQIVDYSHFFQLRMSNEKAYKYGLPCKILFKTDKYVYYGYPYYKYYGNYSLDNPNKELVVNKYYRTDKAVLQSIFPRYDSIEGYHIREIIWNKYGENAENIGFANSMDGFFNGKYTYKLTPKGIEVLTIYIINSEANLYFTRRFIWRTVFDKSTLQVLSNDTLKYRQVRKKKG